MKKVFLLVFILAMVSLFCACNIQNTDFINAYSPITNNTDMPTNITIETTQHFFAEESATNPVEQLTTAFAQKTETIRAEKSTTKLTKTFTTKPTIPLTQAPIKTPTTTLTTCNHNYKNATCTTPKICTKCGATEGTATGHDWGNPTCVTPRSCCVCFTPDPNSEALGHSFVQGVCQVCGDTNFDDIDIDIDIKLQQMAALGIDAAYNSAKFPSTLHLNTVTYEDKVNDYGDPITRMVLRCYASNSAGGYSDIYIVILCCEYETDYIKYEWDGLYFSTSTYNKSPGMCDYILDNKHAMDAYKNLISNPKEIPYD